MFGNPFKKKQEQNPMSMNFSSVVQITEAGKIHIDKSMASGLEADILEELDRYSPQTITKLAENTRMNASKVGIETRNMVRKGLVKIAQENRW